MRKIPALCLLTCLMAISCQKDGSVPTFVAHEYISQVQTGHTTAELQTTIDPSYLAYRHRLLYATNPNMEGAGIVEVAFTGGRTTTSYLSGLQPGTTYYYQYLTDGGVNCHYSSVGSFLTAAYYTPTVETQQPTSVTAHAFVANAQVVSDGGLTITEKGFCYATNESPTISDIKVQSAVAGKGAYSCLIDGLSANTTYYIRAYAVNAQGIAYGQVIQVTTTAE